MQASVEEAEAQERRNLGTGWHCPRCLGVDYDSGEIHVACSFFGKVFDVQDTAFSRVTCRRCRYTEFYNAPASKLESLFDFFVGG